MPCPCSSYVRIANDPCANPLVLQEVVADATETWRAEIEFNGLKKCEVTMEVVDGQPVQLPNVLNEVYTHEMRIFRADGSQVGCYWIGGPVIRQVVECGGFLLVESGDFLVSELGQYFISE